MSRVMYSAYMGEVLCIGFRKRHFEKKYGKLPPLTDRRVAIDDTCFDVDWDALMRLEVESRARPPI